MTNSIYKAIADAASGYVEAPAGCGKTEAIVRSVGGFCDKPQLILTHTHAGVDVLRRRFQHYRISTSRYHVDTIAGWAWGWVRRYPTNANYRGALDIAEWNNVYSAMALLLEKDFVQKVILNSYAGVIVDEYQDCTLPMHQLISELKKTLPCRVLGDPLQGIFGFKDSLVNWSVVENEFGHRIGILDTPHRWIKAGNEPLGKWLINARPEFLNQQEPDFTGSPITQLSVLGQNLAGLLISLTHTKKEKICIIGPSNRGLPGAILTTLANKGYTILETNDLSKLRELIVGLSDSTISKKNSAFFTFLDKAFSGLGAEKNFIEKLIKGEKQRPQLAKRKMLCSKHQDGITTSLILDLLEYLKGVPEITCKLRDSVSALKCILEQHEETKVLLKELYADEISKRKYRSRANEFRCVGSTLLVKGLEFDHAIIVRGKAWGTSNDMYVALTRGSRSVTLLDITD